jgi:hypothetical protein
MYNHPLPKIKTNFNLFASCAAYFLINNFTTLHSTTHDTSRIQQNTTPQEFNCTNMTIQQINNLAETKILVKQINNFN